MSTGGWTENPWTNVKEDAFSQLNEGEDVSSTKKGSSSTKVSPIKEATMFLIDCRENMFRRNSEGQSFLDMSLEAVRETLKSNIFRSTNQMHGILFLGASNEKNEHHFKGIHKLQGLQRPSARSIKQIEILLARETEEDPLVEFRTRIGSNPNSSTLPLHDGLWMTALEMSKAKCKTEDIKQIYLFTNDDDPFRGRAAKAAQTVAKAKEMVEEEEYDIELWCMNPDSSKKFDSTKFYEKILPYREDSVRSCGSSNFDHLIDRVRRKDFQKRCRARIPFQIGNEDAVSSDSSTTHGPFEFGVEVYNCVNFLNKPSATKLEAENNKPTVVRTRWLCDETAAFLLPHEIKTYHFYGKNRVYFTKQDMNRLKTFGKTPHLRMLGFRDADGLRSDLSLRSPYFLRPDDYNFPGSGKVFLALLRRMIARSKIAFVALVSSNGISVPRVYAMVPQKERRDDDGYVVCPAGFNLIAQPYKQEIRDVGPEIVETNSAYPPLPSISSKQRRAAIDVVKNVQLVSFSSRDFENPLLQHHYRTVESLALGNQVEWNADVDDCVKPDTNAIGKKYGNVLDEFNAAFSDIEGARMKSSASKKRKATSSSNPAKKTKRASESAPLTWDLIRRSGKLPSKITARDLKALLAEKGLATTGRKADLMARVLENLKESA